MLSFLVDTQLPPALSLYFRRNGLEAMHTTDYPNGHLLQDASIIEMAITGGRIIVTKDSDFLDHFFLKGHPPDVLLLEVGNISNKDLLQIFELNLQTICKAFNEGSHLVMMDKNNIIQY